MNHDASRPTPTPTPTPKPPRRTLGIVLVGLAVLGLAAPCSRCGVVRLVTTYATVSVA